MSNDSFKQLTQVSSYMRLWFARLLGTMGSQMLMVAVGWQMYELTASAWDLGLVGWYQFLPALLLTLVAGHVADRLHRGHIIAVCFAFQALYAALLIAANLGWGEAAPWTSRELLLALSNQLGEFESGATAALMGPVGSVVAGGVGTLLVAALWFKWFPSLSQRDRIVKDN